MQTDLLINGANDEHDERKHVRRVLARRRRGFEMLETLRVELSRRREIGVPFGVAWQEARAVATPRVVDVRERKAWNVALDATERQWERAYLRQPDGWAQSVAFLGEVS